MDVFLDSSFVISCVKRKIDFLSELRLLGFNPVLPIETYQELKDLKLNLSRENRNAVVLALKLFESEKIKKIKLGSRSADEGLIILGRKGHYIASLDSAVKRSVKNRVVISDSKNSLIVERE